MFELISGNQSIFELESNNAGQTVLDLVGQNSFTVNQTGATQGPSGPSGPAGPAGPATVDASLLSTGTLSDSRLSNNVVLKNAQNSFSVKQTFSQVEFSNDINLIKSGAFSILGNNNDITIDPGLGTNILQLINVAVSKGLYTNGNGANIYVGSAGAFGFGSNSSNSSGVFDTLLRRDAANTLALRNDVNGQVFRVYNTFTNSSNYERGKLEWSSNVFRIGTEKAGTGSARALELQTDGTTRLTIDSTGNATFSGGLVTNGGTQVLPTGTTNNQLIGNTLLQGRLRVHTNTVQSTWAWDLANYGDQHLMSGQGSRVCQTITQDYVATAHYGFAANSNAFVIGSDGASISFRQNPTASLSAGTERFNFNLSTGELTLGTSGILVGGTHLLEQRNSTNSQTFRIYNTTDSGITNYERGKLEWSSNVFRIGTEKAGTGSARALELQTDGTTRLTIGTAGLFTIADALDIAVGTTTGTKIGTATTQKIGFYNKAPVVQPAAVADATDAASVITQLNLLLSRMRDLGLIAT